MKPTLRNRDSRYFSLNQVPDGEGGLLRDSFSVEFLQHPIPGYSPNVFDHVPIEPQTFVDKANALFTKHGIVVPEGYPKNSRVDEEFGKILGRPIISHPWHEFIVCTHCCIIIEEQHELDVSKILRKELIEPSSRAGILHACALSLMVLQHLGTGHKVSIPFETSDAENPDLIVDGIKCEVKAVQESDWVKDTIQRSEAAKREFYATGRGRQHDLAEDFCFDIGKFIETRGHKAIRQGELIFVDLSRARASGSSLVL